MYAPLARLRRPRPTAPAALPAASARRQALHLAAAGLALVVLAAGAWRSVAGWTATRREVAALARGVAAAGVAANKLTALREQVSVREDELARLEAGLPRAGGTPDVLRRVARLAQAAGVAWENYRAGAPAAAGSSPSGATAGTGAAPGAAAGAPPASPRYVAMPLALQFSGGEAALLGLLNSLERDLPAYVVDQVDLGGGAPGGGQAYRLTLTGRLFFLVDAPASPR